MSRTKSIVLSLACAVLAVPARGEPQEEPPSPEALISRARLQQELGIEGTLPLSLRAEIHASNDKWTKLSGDYTLEWVSSSQWKEVIRLANYERLRIRDVKGYWQTTTMSHQPLIIFQLDTLLHLKEALKIETKETLSKVKTRKKNGVQQDCTDIKWPYGLDRTLCFDTANGTLASIDFATEEIPVEISRIEYTDFHLVAGKQIPYEIRALQGGTELISVKMAEISETWAKHPARFAVPANADFWPYCDDLRYPELVDRVPPKYPPGALASRAQGRVIFYAVIESDGSLSHLAVIQRAAPDLQAAALEALQQWRYQPAACHETPVRVETSIAVAFWLRR